MISTVRAYLLKGLLDPSGFDGFPGVNEAGLCQPAFRPEEGESITCLPLNLSSRYLTLSHVPQHDQKKRQMEDKKKKEEEEKREDARKASAVLQHMKKTSEKKQLEYRGIVNSRAAGMATS